MTNITTFVKRHPVLSYFTLTFAISWGGVLLVIGGLDRIPAPSAEAAKLFPFTIMVMLAGPTVAGIVLTGLVYGRAGYRELLSRLLKWQVGARWYAVAILTTPLLIMPVLFALSLTSPVFLPAIVATEGKASLLLSGIAVGLAAGIFEEIGWTGFAVPALRRGDSVLATGLIVGSLWGLWHFLVTFWGSGDTTGALSWDLLLPPLLFYVGVLPVYRVLMVWVYERTGSLLVAMLMHASLTTNTLFILIPPAIGMPLLAYYLILTTALWIGVAAVAVANGRHLSREVNPSVSVGAPQPLPR